MELPWVGRLRDASEEASWTKSETILYTSYPEWYSTPGSTPLDENPPLWKHDGVDLQVRQFLHNYSNKQGLIEPEGRGVMIWRS